MKHQYVAKLRSLTTFLSSEVVACYFLNQVVFPVVKLFLDPSSDEATSYFFQGEKTEKMKSMIVFVRLRLGLDIKHQVDCGRKSLT